MGIERLSAFAGACTPDSVDGLRALLIQAGELEQGVHDHAECSPKIQHALNEVTNCAARAFHSQWRRGDTRQSTALLQTLRTRLNVLPVESDPLLILKIPEGFEFYTLFPEQYCAAADAWARERPPASQSRKVLVVGIRSIGTTLSAVVKVALEYAGWEAHRLTVRPVGHPFNRRIDPDEVVLPSVHRAIVVDEGPGVSGSSIAAVVTWLRQAGVTDISIFPGHHMEPGSAAPEHVRVIWAKTPRYTVPLNRIRWGGLTLEQQLLRKAAKLHQQDGPMGRIIDFSAGLWRKHVYDAEEQWPAVAALFERTKYWCGTRGEASGTRGEETAVLWKFCGLGSAYGPTVGNPKSESRNPKWMGFEALTWRNGSPIKLERTHDPDVLRQGMEYIAESAGPELPPQEQTAAVGRLREILYWNSREAMGEDFATELLHRVQSEHINSGGLSYTDGRMGLHEWIETPGKRLVKVDTRGHLFDHTCVGPQSLLWDVAGFCLEWDLAGVSRAVALAHITNHCMALDFRNLPFYEAAYAAFRMGLCHLAAGQTADPAEQARLHRASNWYRERLRQSTEAASTSLMSVTRW